jgi:hypothetical protein
MLQNVDLRAVLPSIRVPTVIVHREGDAIIPVGNGRYLGDAIPGARYVELPGADHLWWVGDRDAVLDPLVELLSDGAAEAPPERVLATILCAGEAAEPALRAEVERHGGRMLAADLAAFDGPSRAVRCGEALGGGVRAGIHIGECERDGAGLAGPAIDIARRLSELAAAGEILVSRTVVDLVAGSGLRFESDGRALDGPTGPMEVLSAAPA